MMKSTSLFRKYLIIIVLALLLIPVTVPLTSFLYSFYLNKHLSTYYNSKLIQEMWSSKALTLNEDNPAEIKETFLLIKKKFPQSSMFWVDKDGKTQYKLNIRENIPKKWDVDTLLSFTENDKVKNRYTVVSHIGNKKKGFMVFIIPQKYTISPFSQKEHLSYLVMIMSVLLPVTIFITISFIFFKKIQERLTNLQRKMMLPKGDLLPNLMTISKFDEIGALESSFNDMLQALIHSRKKEKEEEITRRKLVADISHDLRTPLTAIRAQLYSLKKEVSSIKGIDTIAKIDSKISYLSDLIDNLLSYSLLSSKKYPYKLANVDMVRTTRNIIAPWYNLLEEKNFEIDVQMSKKPIFWEVDVHWFQRMIDNVIQNVVRHASQGNFIGIYVINNEGKGEISIIDKGPGFNQNSPNKGLGVGLSIIGLMANQMNLEWKISTSKDGTICTFKTKK